MDEQKFFWKKKIQRSDSMEKMLVDMATKVK